MNSLLTERMVAGMRKIKSLMAGAAVAAGVLVAPITASTASAESVYTLSYIGFCFHYSAEGCAIGNVSLVVTTTYNYKQIWINGSVYCTHGGGWVITWCSNTNNGKSYLNVGMNWTGTPQSGIDNGEYSWERMNILANGAGCSPWGGDAGPTVREEYGCEEDYSGSAT
jgi:hypothetical protein